MKFLQIFPSLFVILSVVSLAYVSADNIDIIGDSNEKGINIVSEVASALGGGNASFNGSFTDSTYLRLDATNDPVTGELRLSNDLRIDSGSMIYFGSTTIRNIQHDALGLDYTAPIHKFHSVDPYDDVNLQFITKENEVLLGNLFFINNTQRFYFDRPVDIINESTPAFRINGRSVCQNDSTNCPNFNDTYLLLDNSNNASITTRYDFPLGIQLDREGILFESGPSISTPLGFGSLEIDVPSGNLLLDTNGSIDFSDSGDTFATAGIVKNDASGVVTGGNNITGSDLPQYAEVGGWNFTDYVDFTKHIINGSAGATQTLTYEVTNNDLIMTADVGGTNYFEIATAGAFLELWANPNPSNGYKLFTITETQGSDTEINFYEGGTGHNRFWDSGSARFGGGQDYLCSNLTSKVDCDTASTGADVVIQDDLWLGGKVIAEDGAIINNTFLFNSSGEDSFNIGTDNGVGYINFHAIGKNNISQDGVFLQVRSEFTEDATVTALNRYDVTILDEDDGTPPGGATSVFFARVTDNNGNISVGRFSRFFDMQLTAPSSFTNGTSKFYEGIKYAPPQASLPTGQDGTSVSSKGFLLEGSSNLIFSGSWTSTGMEINHGGGVGFGGDVDSKVLHLKGGASNAGAGSFSAWGIYEETSNPNYLKSFTTFGNMINLTSQGGTLPSCSGGEIAYNDSGHYGCHGGTWNRLY